MLAANATTHFNDEAQEAYMDKAIHEKPNIKRRVNATTIGAILCASLILLLVVCHFNGLLDPLYDIAFPPTQEEIHMKTSGYFAALEKTRHARHNRAFVTTLTIGCTASIAACIPLALKDHRAKQQEIALQREQEQEKVRQLLSNQLELDAEEFLGMRSLPEFTGIYILHNVSKDMYYVGQSVRVVQRVRNHLAGRGNGDVYADFKYGDRFTIRGVAMDGSGYLSIDDLERDMIDAFDALNSGYNRTRGNRT